MKNSEKFSLFRERNKDAINSTGLSDVSSSHSDGLLYKEPIQCVARNIVYNAGNGNTPDETPRQSTIYVAISGKILA